MYKALNYWVYGGFAGTKTPYEFIDFAAAKGLDGVELTVGDAIPVDLAPAECAKIRAYAASKKIGLRTLATGFFWGCSLGAKQEAERQKAVAFAESYLELAARLGAETVLIIPGATRVAWDGSIPETSYQTVWDQSVKSLKTLLVLAEKLKVRIGLENVWNRFLLSPMEWKFYLDQFNSDYLGIYFDTGNCCFIGRPQDYVEILGKRIKAIHIKNFVESDCCGGLHGFGDDLMTGVVDFPALFAALEKIKYDGPLTAEMIPFSRLPDLVLPDQQLAEATTDKLLSL